MAKQQFNSNEKAKTRRPRRLRWHRSDTELSLIALPTFVWFLLFSYLPMAGVVIAFKDYWARPKLSFWQSLKESAWNFPDNFKFLFITGDAWTFINNTLFYNVIGIVLGIILPVTVAIILSELRSKKLMKTTQTLIFFPHFISWVVVSQFLFAFLSPDRGILNNLFESFGGKPVSWYNEPKYWRFILIFMNQWKGIGYGSVLYLASITGIDDTFYEAAMMDGATKWQQIKNITLPHLRPMITILFIMNVGNIFRSGLDMYYQLPRQSNALYDIYMTIDVFVFQAATGNGFIQQGAAIGLLQSAIGLVLVLVANMIVRKLDPESSLF